VIAIRLHFELVRWGFPLLNLPKNLGALPQCPTLAEGNPPTLKRSGDFFECRLLHSVKVVFKNFQQSAMNGSSIKFLNLHLDYIPKQKR
jgi:hypothetical protein